CDARGGSLQSLVGAAVPAAQAAVGRIPLGIHCHNDAELAVANSLEALERGCVQVQGTMNGLGERCGNANLVSLIPTLQLKRGWACVTAEQLARLTEGSHLVYEVAQLEPNKRQAYVGQSAFAHKGGLHVAAVQKNAETYEHVDPTLVGNEQRVLVSDLAGRSNLLAKATQFGIDLGGDEPAVRRLLAELKELESQGYPSEGADAAVEALMRQAGEGG